MNGVSWRCPIGDFPIRLMIMRKAMDVFGSVNLPCDDDFVEDSLNALVPTLEAALYRNAASLEEYGDKNTVQQRLECLAPQHEHLHPLQALFLQELFSCTNTSVDASTTNEDSNSTLPVDTPMSEVDPVATSDPRQFPPAAIHDTTEQPASSAARTTTVNNYVQSLNEVNRLLNAYDAVARRCPVQRTTSLYPLTLPPEWRGQRRRRSRRPGRVDLRCHEISDIDMADA